MEIDDHCRFSHAYRAQHEVTHTPLDDTAGVGYGVGDWAEEGYGSQRAVLRVVAPAAAVRACLPWRRRDANPEMKDIRVFDAAGNRVANVERRAVTRESGEIVFEPTAGPGEYFVYFLPCSGPALFKDSTYFSPEDTADPAWKASCGPVETLPEAELLRFEARSAFDRRDPMELIATPEEQETLLAKHPGDAYLLFSEDRLYPVRMRTDLPYRWIRRGPTDAFTGQVQPGETYAFQIGVYACREAITGLALTTGDLRGPGGARIGADSIRCINLGGVDWEGRAFQKRFEVELGQVCPLWVLVDVPLDAPAGEYSGEIILQPQGAGPAAHPPVSRVQVTLAVAGEALPDHGWRDAWRQSRLGWLDSTRGSEDTVMAPYQPLKMEGDTIYLLNRSLRFGPIGFPESLVSNGHELLAAPLTFRVDALRFNLLSQETRQVGAARICRVWHSQSDGLRMEVAAQVDFDGCLEYRVRLQADRSLHTQEICLSLALPSALTEYFMGLGVRGGKTPAQVDWKWDIDRITNMLWTGSPQAGLHLNLMHSQDVWPQAYTYRPWGTPVSWDHGGGGTCTFRREAETSLIDACCGPRDWQPGEVEEYRFRLLVTPFKPLDPKQWAYRYWSKTALHLPDPDDGPAHGVTIAHLHHGTAGVNPWINYPFLTIDSIWAFRERLTRLGYQDVDLYYTLREISSHMSEVWALRSLGSEIYIGSEPGMKTDGEVALYQSSGGYAWLQEHLVDGYSRAWMHVYENGEVDASIATQGLSRLHNFYVEGMDLLMKATGCGGLYLDGLAYGRGVLQRVARVMAENRADYRIKFHSGNNFDYADWRCNVLLQYAEHLPYITDLWIGEMFDYDLPPDYWLVEMSGLPFGLTSEMLNYEDGGNPWRGMLYGMDGRMHPSAPHLWKVWDKFGIKDAALWGYWDAGCPVQTGQEDILATVYLKPGQAFVALASWRKEDAQVRLAFDWTALGLDPETARLAAPEIEAFQPAASFRPGDEIRVAAGKGWLFILAD